MHISLAEACKAIDEGRLVAIPTETVYGLAARIDRPQAIEAIFKAKGRPRQNPLIVHVETAQSIANHVDWSYPRALDLVDAFWPGSLTLLLPLVSPWSSLITSGLPHVAVRCPDHPLCLELLRHTGPLVAPSANPSGRPSPSCASHVIADYSGAISVLDGGPCKRGVESTILAWDKANDQWIVARLGALSPEQLAHVLGYKPERMGGVAKAICPGQQWRHYAPLAQLSHWQASPIRQAQMSIADRQGVVTGFVIGFHERGYGLSHLIPLGSENNPEECLSNLYSCLREVDALGATAATVDMNFPTAGLWLTLRERLEKAIGGSRESF